MSKWSLIVIFVNFFVFSWLEKAKSKEIFLQMNNDNLDKNISSSNNEFFNIIKESQNESNLIITLLDSINEYVLDAALEILFNFKIRGLINSAKIKFKKYGFFMINGNSSVNFENITFIIEKNYYVPYVLFVKKSFELNIEVKMKKVLNYLIFLFEGLRI